jgi:protein-tyrosine-phosphatase
MNVLFVCTANISRSYLAEYLFKHLLLSSGIDAERISVASAGVHALPSSPPDPKMVAYLEERGAFTGEHESCQLTEEAVAWADMVLVMEMRHKDAIISAWPQGIDKTELLGVYIPPGGVEDDIMDPFGRSPFHYRSSQSQIAFAVETLIKKIQSADEGGHA